MADTVESLTAEIAALEVAMTRSLAVGASTSMPGGSAHAGHDPMKIESLIRSRKARLARLQAINANLPPFASRLVP